MFKNKAWTEQRSKNIPSPAPHLYSELWKSSMLLGKLLNLPPLPLSCWLSFLKELHQVGLKTWGVSDKMLNTTCPYLQEWEATVGTAFITITFQGCTQIQCTFEWKESTDKRRPNFLSIYTNFSAVNLSSLTCKLDKS